jgi:hypothetical protein
VARSGDKNTSFGIYKSACCGREIAISERATFPECPAHGHQPTEWIAVGESNQALHLVVLPQEKKSTPAA